MSATFYAKRTPNLELCSLCGDQTRTNIAVQRSGFDDKLICYGCVSAIRTLQPAIGLLHYEPKDSVKTGMGG